MPGKENKENSFSGQWIISYDMISVMSPFYNVKNPTIISALWYLFRAKCLYPPPNSYTENLTTIYWYLEVGPLGIIRFGCGYKYGVPMMELVALWKKEETPNLLFSVM